MVIRKISERAVLFEYSNISFGSTCFRSKCAFCSPYQLGMVLEASTVLLIVNVVKINNQVWISLSSLLDQIALFVSTSKDWSTAMEDHLWVNMSVLVFFFLFIWVEFENYHSGVFFFISLVFFKYWNVLLNSGAALYQLFYKTNKQVRYVMCLRADSQRWWTLYTRGESGKADQKGKDMGQKRNLACTVMVFVALELWINKS